MFYIKGNDIYEPEDDTFLMYNTIKKEIFNKIFGKEQNKKIKILEIGTGSGYIILNLYNYLNKKNVLKNKDITFLGIDINPNSINLLKKFVKENKNFDEKIIQFQNKNFENLKGEFDFIIFNPPYLPFENNETLENYNYYEKAIYGGKKGNEITLNFINNLYNLLKLDGTTYLLLSSLSKPEKTLSYILDNEFSYLKKNSKNEFFEKLIVIKIELSKLLKRLKDIGVKDVKYFSKGKHSKVFSGNFINKKSIIKVGKEKDIEKEFYFLEYLKNEKFVSKVYFYEKEILIKEFIEGTLTEDYIKKNNKEEILKVLEKTLGICFTLDKYKINKFELTNPHKHIFITKNNEVKMIDFERSIFTEKPKNVTQILQYFVRLNQILNIKNITFDKSKIYNISKKYKKNYEKFDLIKILK